MLKTVSTGLTGNVVTSVTATAPVNSSGGATPNISMAAATTSNDGYLTATDWNTFNNKGNGTVTSVSVVSANGFAGTVATSTTTPAITLSTSITGVLKGNGTAISAATANTDYLIPALANTAVTGFKTITFNGQINNAATSGSITVDWTTGNYQLQAAPTAPITYTFTAPVGISHLQLFISAPTTAQTITFPGNFYWLGATWSGANGKASVISIFYDGTNYYGIGTNQV